MLIWRKKTDLSLTVSFIIHSSRIFRTFICFVQFLLQFYNCKLASPYFDVTHLLLNTISGCVNFKAVLKRFHTPFSYRNLLFKRTMPIGNTDHGWRNSIRVFTYCIEYYYKWQLKEFRIQRIQKDEFCLNQCFFLIQQRFSILILLTYKYISII